MPQCFCTVAPLSCQARSSTAGFLNALLIISFSFNSNINLSKLIGYHNWMKEVKSIQKCDMRNKISCKMMAMNVQDDAICRVLLSTFCDQTS